MPWFVVVADLLASQYGWPRREIWEEIPLAECALYVRAIVDRRMREEGNEQDIPTDVTILELLDVIDMVKLEKQKLKELPAHGS